MSRTVNQEQKLLQKEKILSTAEDIFKNKGYENTSLNDVIRNSGIAKGTFYHYFPSKDALIDYLSKKMTEQVLRRIKKIVERDDLSAIEKFNKMIDQSKHYKIANRRIYRVFTQWIYSEKNEHIRMRFLKHGVKDIVPVMANIIRQGIKEKSFQVSDADEAAEIFFNITISIGDKLGPLLATGELNNETKKIFKRKARAYNEAIERILGVKKGQLVIFEESVLDQIFEK